MSIRIAGLVSRSNHHQTSSQIEEELRFHIASLERKYAQDGMCVAEAKAAALRRFGNVERIKQQCVNISRRNSPLRRLLRISSILIGLTGLAIHILSSDLKVAHVGDTLVMIAIAGRLLLYVRGLKYRTFLPGTKQTSLSAVSDTPEDKSACL